jgi:hypothetical protein
MAAKFGFYYDELKAAILTMDAFPRCLDRYDFISRALGVGATMLIKQLPAVLTGYCEKITMDMWGRCTTPINILLGNCALGLYQIMLSKRKIEIKVIYLNSHLKRHQSPHQIFCPPSLN